MWLAWTVLLFLLSFFLLLVEHIEIGVYVVDGLDQRKRVISEKRIIKFRAMAKSLEGLAGNRGLGEATNLR